MTLEQEDAVRWRLDAAGPGPSAVELKTDVPDGAEELDRRLSHGVSIALQRPS